MAANFIREFCAPQPSCSNSVCDSVKPDNAPVSLLRKALLRPIIRSNILLRPADQNKNLTSNFIKTEVVASHPIECIDITSPSPIINSTNFQSRNFRINELDNDDFSNVDIEKMLQSALPLTQFSSLDMSVPRSTKSIYEELDNGDLDGIDIDSIINKSFSSRADEVEELMADIGTIFSEPFHVENSIGVNSTVDEKDNLECRSLSPILNKYSVSQKRKFKRGMLNLAKHKTQNSKFINSDGASTSNADHMPNLTIFSKTKLNTLNIEVENRPVAPETVAPETIVMPGCSHWFSPEATSTPNFVDLPITTTQICPSQVYDGGDDEKEEKVYICRRKNGQVMERSIRKRKLIFERDDSESFFSQDDSHKSVYERKADVFKKRGIATPVEIVAPHIQPGVAIIEGELISNEDPIESPSTSNYQVGRSIGGGKQFHRLYMLYGEQKQK